MSKTLRTVGMVVAAVALVATGVGALAGAGVLGAAAAGSAGVVAGMSVATVSAIGTYAGIAASVIGAIASATAPGFSAQGSASTFQTNPQSGLPYAMGRTRMSGLRTYARTYDGFKQQSKDDILAFMALLTVAGPIQGIEQFTADGEVVTFASDGNAVGRYHDYMGQQVSLGAKSGPALNMAFGGRTFPGWTAGHKLSGMAHAQWAMRFDTKGELYGAGAPEPAWIGKWVLVYDPRLDSTYPGGSGPCRTLQEETYVWSDNPGLHALTWSLGRWLNGKRVCGIGAPVENIRVAEFVECANVCEANNWKVGGVEWTTDSKWDSLKRILQAGGAVPTKTGAMIGCMVSAPRTAIATIESRHLHDGASFPMTKSRRDRFNTVIPRYVDEDSDWSVVSGKAVSEPVYVTADGGPRTKEIDFPLVQVFSGEEAKQPGQLAAYAIVDSREAGPWTFSTGPEWLGLKTGDVVYLNVPEEGIANQPVLITRRALDPASTKVSFTVQTETYSKHAYALGETTVPPAPFSLTAPDLRPAAPLALNWNVAGTTSGEGFPALLVTGESQHPSADAVFIDYRRTGTDAWTSSAIMSAIAPVSHVIAPLESQSAYDVRIGYRIGTIDGDVTIFANVTTGTGRLTIIDGIVGQSVTRLVSLEDIVAPTGPLWSAINDQGTTISQQSGTIGDLQGRTLAYWQVEANAGGAGTDAFVTVRAETAPGAPVTSNVAIGADTFMVYNPAAGAWLKTLEVSGGNVRIYGNLAVDGAVTTNNITQNAVTRTLRWSASYGSSGVSGDAVIPSGSAFGTFGLPGDPAERSVSVTNAGAEVTIQWYVNVQRTGDGNDRTTYRLRRTDQSGNVTYVGDVLKAGMGNYPVTINWAWDDTDLSIGTYTYAIEARQDAGGGNYFNAKLIAEVGYR